MNTPEVRAIKEDVAVMAWRNLVVALWRSKPTQAGVKEVAVHYRQMCVRYPEGFVVCVIVEDGVSLPDESVRRSLSELMKEVQHRIIGMCGVQEATGFRGAAIRSVNTAIVLLSRVPYKTTTVSTVREAAEWIAPLIGPDCTPGQILVAISKVRAQVEQKLPS